MGVSIHRSALLPFSAGAVFDIVNDVARYPEFLPWCAGAEVIEQSAGEVVATLMLKSRGISESFTTRNQLVPGRSIELELVSGPFKELRGCWTFSRLGASTAGTDGGCRVDLRLHFQVSGMKMLLTAVFSRAADQMVDAFCQRANQILRIDPN